MLNKKFIELKDFLEEAKENGDVITFTFRDDNEFTGIIDRVWMM